MLADRARWQRFRFGVRRGNRGAKSAALVAERTWRAAALYRAGMVGGDKIDIMSVDLDIRPYDWEMRGSRGRTAYLQAIHVTQNTDRFAARFADEEYPEE